MSSGVAVDSCVLIDFFRAKDKSNTVYAKLIRNKEKLYVSTVVLFEVRSGLNKRNRDEWDILLQGMTCLSFDEHVAEVAADLSIRLRKSRIQLESSDLFIAASALTYGIPLATLNRKHFERIDGLKLVLPE